MTASRPWSAWSIPAPRWTNQTSGVPSRLRSVITALSSFLSTATHRRVADPRFLGIYEDVDPTSKETFRHYLFLVTRWDGEPRIANEEHTEIHWFPPEDVDSLNLAASIRESIHRVLPRKA